MPDICVSPRPTAPFGATSFECAVVQSLRDTVVLQSAAVCLRRHGASLCSRTFPPISQIARLLTPLHNHHASCTCRPCVSRDCSLSFLSVLRSCRHPPAAAGVGHANATPCSNSAVHTDDRLSATPADIPPRPSPVWCRWVAVLGFRPGTMRNRTGRSES